MCIRDRQEKFAGTSVEKLTPAEKRDLSKFVERQAKKTAAQAEQSAELEKELEVEKKRRLFAEFERSTDVVHVINMHHQTRLLAGKIFKLVDRTLTTHQKNPEKLTTEKLINVLESVIFDVDKIRKVAAFASKAKFNLKTNKANLDLLQFCLLYTSPSPRDATLSRMPSSA